MCSSSESFTDVFEHNLALLRQHHPQVWQAVKDYGVGSLPGELHTAADGNPNLVGIAADGSEVFFHDPRDPRAELADYYALVPKWAAGGVAFIGMGLGYAPQAMLIVRPALRHIMVFEPEVGIFIQALRSRDLTEFLADARVSIAVGAEIDVGAVMLPAARALQLESFHVLKHNPGFRVFGRPYQAVYDQVFKLGNSFNISGNTTRAYGAKFIDNRLRNLTTMPHQCLFEQLKDVFKGVPAILVAGGPSLDKNIHLLRQAENRAVIFAVDTALPALLAHGVTPDFTGSIDMQDIVLEKIVDVADARIDTALVCSSWVNPLVPKIFPARQVHWTFTAKNMEKWLNGIWGGKVHTAGSGTVAQLNFTAAALLGCSPIVFVGQDLSFAGNKSHAGHTSLTTAPSGIDRIKAGKQLVTVEAYGGGHIQTTRQFLGYRHTFEQSMAALPDRLFINATEGGVRLVGTEELPLQEVLAQYCSQERGIAAIIRAAEESGEISGHRRLLEQLNKLGKQIERSKKDLDSVDRLVANVESELQAMMQKGAPCSGFNVLPASFKKRLAELDQVNRRLDQAGIWALLDEATMEGLRLSERLNHELLQLAASPDSYAAWLAKSLERFQLISRFRRLVLAPFTSRLHEVRNHLQREMALGGQSGKKTKGRPKKVPELLRLYHASGDIVLLERLLNTHHPETELASDFPEAAFYRGVIAANRCLYLQMEEYFAAALAADSSLAEKIEICRRDLADRYLTLGLTRKNRNSPVANRMLFKAVRFSAGHQRLRETLLDNATDLLHRAEKVVTEQDGWPEDLAELLALWSRELTVNLGLTQVLEPRQTAELHRFHAVVLLAGEKFAEALAVLQAAIAMQPDAPWLHLLLADAALAAGDFSTGVAALNQAVALDRTCARHWQGIGDALLAAGQPQDALAAYEKCFTALPEESSALRKMGDCYQALGQLEAALEAYRLCRERS